jgi:hypothetical protein
MDIAMQRPTRWATRANLFAAGRNLADLEQAAASAVIENSLAHVRNNSLRVFNQHAKRHAGAGPDDWETSSSTTG